MPDLSHVDKYPELPVSLIPTLGAVKTGEWRNMKPVLAEKTSPCTAECPGGVLIPHYFHALTEGRMRDAAEAFWARNPFPRITGRVCPHFCESACNRAPHDSAVAIRSVERFLGDAIAQLPPPEPGPDTGKSVAVVGSGPGGLAAAFYLRRAGHRVVILEKMPKAGGLLRYGIPGYRLPNAIVDEEIARLQAMGVELKTGVELGKDMGLEELKAEHDAVFIATGAWQERDMRVEGEELITEGLPFLVEVNRGEARLPGKHCAVVGGGNTAMDVARVLVRLGARVSVLYRRTEAEMPAIPEEVAKAREEGVEFRFLTLPRAVKKKGQSLEVRVERMELGEPDDSGRRRPVPTGEMSTLEFDAVFKAVGELADTSPFPQALKDEGGWLAVNPDGSTADERLFAGGDLVTGPGTVIEALAWGRRAAFAICDKIGGEIPVPDWLKGIGEEVVTPEMTNPAYFPRTERNESPGLPPAERIKAGFSEESSTLTQEEALAEVARCLSCGHCNSCGTCFVFCPDVAIRWGPGPEFDYDYCKGCGICPAECPGHVIDFVREKEF